MLCCVIFKAFYGCRHLRQIAHGTGGSLISGLSSKSYLFQEGEAHRY